MQSTRENNHIKFRSKISNEFWEIAVFLSGDVFQPHPVTDIFHDVIAERKTLAVRCAALRDVIFTYWWKPRITQPTQSAREPLDDRIPEYSLCRTILFFGSLCNAVSGDNGLC